MALVVYEAPRHVLEESDEDSTEVASSLKNKKKYVGLVRKISSRIFDIM